MIEFQDVQVIINKSGVLADSANLGSSNGLDGLYALGHKGTITVAPAGELTSNLNISYTPEVIWEPNLEIINKLKTIHTDFHYQPETGSVAGISGYFYLQSYTLRSSPNEPNKASASYISYQPTSGNILLTKSLGPVSFDNTDSSGIMHGYSTIVNMADASSPPILEFEYDFKADWVPTYSLGSIYPTQVQLAGGEETLTFIRDVYSGIVFSGEASTSHLSLVTPETTVLLTGVSYSNSFSNTLPRNFGYKIDASGSTLLNEMVASVNDIVKIRSTIKRFF